MRSPSPAIRQGKYLPLSDYQSRMLVAALDPETAGGFHLDQTVSWAVRITPGVSPRTLRRAFDELVRRHDSLRLRFVDVGREWRAEILPDHPLGLIVETLGDMSEAAQADVVAQRCSKPLTALSESMFDMRLLKFGGAGDVILARIHHAIIDGYSIALLLEELLKHALSMPVIDRPVSHGEFIAHRSKKVLDRAAEKEDFWKEALLPLPDKLRVGRHAKGLPPLSPRTVGTTNALKNFLSLQTAERVEALAKSTGVSAFCYLHAAFADTLCAQAGQEAVLLHSIVGRRHAEIASFIGAEIILFPLKYTNGSGAAWVSNQIATSTEMLPTSAFSQETVLRQTLRAENVDWYRFLVHRPTPTGRLSNSPFRKIFEEALLGKMSVGFITIERIDLAKKTETDFEAQLNITPTAEGLQASLLADAASWSQSDLTHLAQEIEARTLFC